MGAVSRLWIADRPLLRPLGIGEERPTISWQLAVAGTQLAYEIEGFDGSESYSTGRINSSDSIGVTWPFASLTSRERLQIRVRVWEGAGDPSDWSEPLDIEAGLMNREDWRTNFVSPSAVAEHDRPRPAFLMRAAFELAGEPLRARLYLAAHGVFELECNGSRVDDSILSPGWTSYEHRVRYETVDLTDRLNAGVNALGVWLADGWYRGRVGFNGGLWDNYGTDVSVLAQLEVAYAEGTSEIIPLDDLWQWAPSPIDEVGLYEGERFDAREERTGFSRPGFDAQQWSAPTVLALEDFPAEIVPPSGAPVRPIEVLAVERVESRPDGQIRLDFGQNISGRLRIRVDGPRGHEVKLHHAEVLEHDELAIRPLRQAPSVDTYICDGSGETWWEPRFTLHGFRFAEIENWPGEFTADAVVAVVVHTDLERTGWFETSDPMLNRLHENVVWSMRDNFVDIPTDCPQRDERLGWTGDIQVFGPTASFLFDVHGTLSGWLQDLAAEQKAMGSVPNFVPWIECGFPPQPAAAWGDAAVVLPWVLFEQFGDLAALERQYPSMKAWVDQVGQLVESDELWTSGFQLGDWLDPTAPPTNPADSRTDPYLVASAYRIRSARILAQTASILGRTADERHYLAIVDTARQSFQQEWVSPRGRISSDTVTAYALAITFDLLDDGQLATAGARLAKLVENSNFTITTGFVGTPLVCDALVQTGNLDTAYHLLQQRDYPSWLYPVTMGATTMWERWDSMLPDGSVNPGEMTSFNHYAFGAVADFMHRVIGGLGSSSPGWETISVAPKPSGGLSWARARHLTPRGLASTHWRRDGHRFELEVVVPPGTTASVELPDGTTYGSVQAGTHRFSCALRAAEADPVAPRPFNIHNPEERERRAADAAGRAA